MTGPAKKPTPSAETKSQPLVGREPPLDRETLIALIEEGQRNRAAFEAAAGATRVITSDDLKFRCR